MKQSISDRIVAFVGFLLAMLKALCDALMVILVLLLRGKLSGRTRGEDCCIRPPDQLRPRPDPYVYSQGWLHLRGLAYTWDNPDFTLLDAGGNAVNRMNLQPGTEYKVVVRVHNGSLFASVNTKVALDVLEFGVSGIATAVIGSTVVDVPAFGEVDVPFTWTTPLGGHNCLRVQLSQADDGNPLNNVGQHNTVIATPEGPMHKSAFVVRNRASSTRSLRLKFDSYRLPQERLRARSVNERNSIEYLRALRERNNSSNFPVPEAVRARVQLGPSGAQSIVDSNPSHF
jgi:hypothetical protein